MDSILSQALAEQKRVRELLKPKSRALETDARRLKPQGFTVHGVHPRFSFRGVGMHNGRCRMHGGVLVRTAHRRGAGAFAACGLYSAEAL